MALCPGLPGWAGIRKKHSPTHHPDHHPIFISLLHPTTIHSILPVQITCLAIFLHNTGCKNYTKDRHLHTIGYIYANKACIDNRKKNLLNSYISSTCPHNVVNFSLLLAEIGWWVWGTPANFNSFLVLASLLHRCRSTELNQTLHDVCPSPGLVHYINIFGGFCPLMEFIINGILPGAKFTLCPSLAFSYIFSGTAWHSSSWPNCAAWYKEWNYRTFTDGATIWQGGHHVGHPPTFLVF